MSTKDVEKSSGASREEWRSAIQSDMQSLREHDVCQEVAEDERCADCMHVWFLTKNRCENCSSLRISGRSRGGLSETFTSAVALGFHWEKRFVETPEGFCGLRSAPRLGSHERRCPRCTGHVSRKEEYVLRESCADLAPWIIVCLLLAAGNISSSSTVS